METEAAVRQRFVQLTTGVAFVAVSAGLLVARLALGERVFPVRALVIGAAFLAVTALLHLASRRSSSLWMAAVLLGAFVLLPLALALFTPSSLAPTYALPVILLLPVFAAGPLVGPRASYVVAGFVLVTLLVVYRLQSMNLETAQADALLLTHVRGAVGTVFAAAISAYFAHHLTRLIDNLREKNAMLARRSRLQSALAELGQRALEGPDELGAAVLAALHGNLELSSCAWLVQDDQRWSVRAGQALEPLPEGALLARVATGSLVPLEETAARAYAIGLGSARWGALVLVARGPQALTDDERQFVESSAALLRASLARAQAEEQRALAEERLRAAQKMEALGQLAGGIAHDFNNMLTVMTSSSVLLGQQELASDQRALLDDMDSAIERAAGLTRQLLTFSRRRAHEPKVLDVNAVLQGLASLLRRVVGENIEVELRLASNLGRVRVDHHELEQVLVNLVANARAAMPHGGKVTLETARHLEATDAGPDRPWVRLWVKDAGSGMSKTVLARIFEPFFTTKAPGEGTGLGLAMVQGFVELAHGRIEVQSEPGRGTAFQLDLPEHQGEAAAEAEPEEAQLVRGRGAILLVEDDEAVRRTTERVLRHAGYSVTAVGRPLEALGLTACGSFDLVVTDVVMPGISGPELVEELRRVRPQLKVLFVSGYLRERPGLEALLRNEPFLAKPFTPQALTAAVVAAMSKGDQVSNESVEPPRASPRGR